MRLLAVIPVLVAVLFQGARPPLQPRILCTFKDVCVMSLVFIYVYLAVKRQAPSL